jgi:hypothetical protein
MRKTICICIVLLILAGCNEENEELSYSKVEEDSTNKLVQDFITSVEDENGIHLFQQNENTMYAFLNGHNVEQGNDASFFSGFEVKGKDDTLNIYFDEEYTDDYANKTLNNQELYKINLDKKYEVVRPFKNNEETNFKVIYVTGK